MRVFRVFFLTVFLAGAASVAVSPAASARVSVEETSALYEDAVRRHQSGDHTGAVIQLKNLLQADPNNLLARVLIGKAYLGTGDAASAEKELVRAREAGADPEVLIVPLGMAYLAQEKYMTILESIPAQGWSRTVGAAVRNIRGQVNLAIGKPDDAEAEFMAASALDPTSVDPILGQARVALSRGASTTARGLIDAAVERNPDSAVAWSVDADYRFARRDLDGALASHNKALELEPYHIPSRLGRAGILIHRRESGPALEDLKFVREHLPQNENAAYLTGLALMQQGKRLDAEQAFRDAEAVIRSYPPGYLERTPSKLLTAALVHFAIGNLADATSFATRYAAADPFHSGVQVLLGRLLLRQNSPALALDHLDRALRLVPTDSEARNLYGIALLALKRFDEAAKAFREAQEAGAESTGTSANLALSELGSGGGSDAIKILEETIETDQEAFRPGVMLALVYMKSGDFARALEVSEKLVARRPDSPIPHNLAGAALWGLGRGADARKALETALRHDPNYADAIMNLAKIDLAAGKADIAKGRYRSLIQRDETATKALVALAGIAEREGDLTGALGHLEKARGTSRDEKNIVLRLIDLQIRAGNSQRALELSQRLRNKYAEDLPILERIGRAEAFSGNREAAKATYARMSTLAKYEADKLLRIARLQSEIQDFDGAHLSLSQALRNDGDNFAIHAALIRLEGQMRRFDSGLDRARLLADQLPDDPLGPVLMGELYMQAGLKRDAAKAFQAAFDRKEDAGILMRFALAERESGNPAGAIAKMERWLATHPADTILRFELASAYEALGRLDDARQQYETLLETHPQHPAVLNNLASLYHKAGDPRGLEFAQKAYGLAPKRPETLDTLGWIMMENGQVREALPLLREAHARDARRMPVRYHLAVALGRLGQTAEAKEHLEAILKFPDESGDLAQKAQAFLAELQNN